MQDVRIYIYMFQVVKADFNNTYQYSTWIVFTSYNLIKL